MNIIDAAQGGQEWLDIRAKHFTASEAPAMMGASKYQTRSALLKQKATGLTPDIDANTQRLFDRGHASEAAARSIVEATIDDDLSPITGWQEIDGLPLLASFDGITQTYEIVWESKLWNAALADSVRAGQLDPHYYWQLEQQILVSGAEKVYFTASDGTQERTVGMWYSSHPERRAALIAGWKQFAEDLANYVHVEATVAPVAATIKALPALFVQVEGKVLATNLDQFKASAQTFIANINTNLQTDQDFADADKMVKFLKDGEERLALCKSQALAQTASIDELFRTVDAISEQMRSKRLSLDKLVKAEKENRRAEIVVEAQNVLMAHRAALTQRIGGNWLPPLNPQVFTEAIKGLKSLDSMRDKVSAALANAKIEANEIADRISANRLEMIGELDWSFLFPDFASVCTKAREDFNALLMARIAKHNEAQAAKDKAAKEAEEARIAAAVEAERRAGEARAAAAIEAERLAEAKRAAAAQPTYAVREQHTDDQGEKADAGVGLGLPSRAQPDVASIPPITAKKAVAAMHDANDAAMITEYIALQACSPGEKKAMRAVIEKWEAYRTKVAAAREMGVAA